MWDVSEKSPTVRTARAEGVLRIAEETYEALRNGTVPKGDPLPVAKTAAILAVKRTPEIVPYCHPLPIESVRVEFEVAATSIVARVEVKTSAKTGVEMEALTGVSAALLTLYDMLKQLDLGMEIAHIRLLEKQGGKSDFRRGAA